MSTVAITKQIAIPPPGFDDLTPEEKIRYVGALWERAIDDQANGPTLRAGMSSDVEIDTGKYNSLLGRLQGAKEPEPQTRVAARNSGEG